MPAAATAASDRINWRSSTPFLALHLVPLAAIWTGVTSTALVLLAVTYFSRCFFITAGYHRYFSHRSYRMARVPQFLMAFGGTTASQKGPLWWAAHHRNHHRFADTDRDVHSPTRGFWWSQVGWILCDRFSATEVDEIRDFARSPEIRFLNKHDWIGPWSLAVVCFLVGGWSGLVIGFFLSTVLLWHGTFLVNSLAHMMGRRAYDTPDRSRNTLLVALITGGEGWHNNHHRYQSSARQGFRWWQIDMTYYVLRVLSVFRVVRDLRPVPERVLVEAHPGIGIREVRMPAPRETVTTLPTVPIGDVVDEPEPLAATASA